MTEDFRTLIEALAHVCETFEAQSASATFISPLEGRLVTLQVTAGGLVTIEDEDGHLVAVPGGLH